MERASRVEGDLDYRRYKGNQEGREAQMLSPALHQGQVL